MLLLDAAFAVGFGLASGLFPAETFGTIVDLSGASDLLFAVLTGLSTSYVVIGACAVAFVWAGDRGRGLGSLVMAGRHAFVGARGFVDLEAGWLVGDPSPDIVIHAGFVLSYLALLLWWRRRQIDSPSRVAL